MTTWTAVDLDGRMVQVVSGEQPHWVGRARNGWEGGWIEVHLDALDPGDDRVLWPVSPDDVILRLDLEES